MTKMYVLHKDSVMVHDKLLCAKCGKTLTGEYYGYEHKAPYDVHCMNCGWSFRVAGEFRLEDVEEEDIVEKARDFAKAKHGTQVDDCGKPYFESHIEQVVAILRQVSDDQNLLASAYLHDTIEDTKTTYDELSKAFGTDVAELVMEVTHEGDKEGGYYFPRLKTKRGILLKFADRVSNLSRMEAWSEKRQEHYLRKSQFWRSEE